MPRVEQPPGAESYLPGLREHARPHLEDLQRQSAYTTAIAILEGTEILYIDRLPGHRRGQGQIDLHPGSRLPAYCTAMGKALLACLPEPEQRAVIGEVALKRYGPHTITSKTELRAELRCMAQEGIAVNDQELAPGLHAIAAPVRDQYEVVAAVCIAAPAAAITLEEMVEHLTPHLRCTADRISARLGCRFASSPSRRSGPA